MHILVIGATGLIGAAAVARLAEDGHEVTGIARNISRGEQRWSTVRWIGLDLSKTALPDLWLPHLAGVQAVVNCAGLLQDAPGESLRDVHERGVAALFEACARMGVRRVVQLSAIGIDRATPTKFSLTKLAGDQALMRHDLDWVILRPSVVVGRAAYGGSALFRGLAALPVLPVMPNTAPLQIVQIDQVTETIGFFVKLDAPARLTLELAGPDRLALTEVVGAYRRWLGWPEARLLTLPAGLAGVLFRARRFCRPARLAAAATFGGPK